MRKHAPTSSARNPATSAASALPAAASGRTAAATSAEIDPSGPMISRFDEPSRT
jgi:hypothetical protein